MNGNVVHDFVHRPFHGWKEFPGIIKVVEYHVSDAVDDLHALLRVLDPVQRNKPPAFNVAFKILTVRKLQQLEQIHARQVTQSVVVAVELHSMTSPPHVLPPRTHRRYGRTGDETFARNVDSVGFTGQTHHITGSDSLDETFWCVTDGGNLMDAIPGYSSEKRFGYL